MKKAFLILLLVPLVARAQNLITYQWKFSTGDNMEWSEMEFDDSSWKEINVSQTWEKQGYPAYDGFGWYRTTVLIPSDLKKLAEDNGGFILDLGSIDDSDEIYWNGDLFARHGSLPPDYVSAYDQKRILEIPVNEINWDNKNYIAVRVYDGQGNGGIIAPDISLRVKGMSDLVKMNINPPFPDHIYTDVKDVIIPFEIQNNYSKSLEGDLAINIFTDFGENIYSSEERMKLRKNRTYKTEIVVDDPGPGFYNASITFKGSMENKSFNFAFGKDPEKIISPLDRPEDFEDYWSRAKKELAAVAPQFKMIYQESMSTPSREVYLVEMRSLGNVLVRGWYGRPVKKGTYPAILHVQGYSSNQTLGWSYPGDDMVVFALNIRGHGNSRSHINPGFPGYLQYFIQDPEMYIYRGAYMDCIRAVDFLFSRPEVDTTRIIVEGGSQGGALSFATAALDNERITLCVPHVPFLSDFKDYFKVATWPASEFIVHEKKHPEVSWDDIYNTLSYIDIKNLAPWIKAPLLMGVGLIDQTCPPHINFAAYNHVNSDKEYVVYPWSGHAIDGSYHSFKYEWIKKQLNKLD
ncbi:MAG: acetylxylan esterase [Bacteroidales bacterium]